MSNGYICGSKTEILEMIRNRNLYGWDCECVLILNDKCIKEWKKVDFDIDKDILERKRKRMGAIDKVIEELLNEKER
ncbi:MAG: hypothetical protein LAN71_17090 [Acidobacteriia bacterium]|nr:hypothetical protein [Terriglobia bacterium]